jgi:hypothetical protein
LGFGGIFSDSDSIGTVAVSALPITAEKINSNLTPKKQEKYVIYNE